MLEHGHVAGAVADEGEILRRQVRHDDLAGFARRQHAAVAVDDLDDDVLGGEVHAAARALVGDEAGIASAVAVGDAAAEDAGDGLALVVVQPLAGDEGDADAEVVHALAARFGVAGDVAERAGVAEQHLRPPAPDGGDEAVELGLAHLERGQQLGAQQLVAPGADAILAAQFDG